jgi:uroporphyrinogen-III synthase
VSLILILRPEPGASETAGRARELGLHPVVAPLFTVRPLSWEPPEGPFDAVLLTSANAPRHGGGGLARFLPLPCFAVGEATARAAEDAGFTSVQSGAADGAAALASAVGAGSRRILHLCGREHIQPAHPGALLMTCPVYAADVAGELPREAKAAIAVGSLALLHSPRAAASFAALVDDRSRIHIAAISPAAADAAGAGWGAVHVTERPRDQALLELAAKLCKTAPPGEQYRV